MTQKVNSYKTLVLAFIFVCAIFSLSASAQLPPLTKDGLAKFVEKLKATLAESIDDEETRNSIIEKWDARMKDLVGETMGGVNSAFSEDVAEVTEDEELVNNLRDKFLAVLRASYVPTPEKMEPVRKPSIWIKVVQDGWYVAHFELTWDEPNRPNLSRKESGKTKGWQEVFHVPGESTNIRLKMTNDTGLVWQPQREIFNKVMQPSDLNKCYRTTGTTLGSASDNDCQ